MKNLFYKWLQSFGQFVVALPVLSVSVILGTAAARWFWFLVKLIWNI